MRIRFSLIVAALAVVIGLAGCRTTGARAGSGTIPTLNAGAARSAGLSLDDVTAATHLYTAKCARCHKFYDPGIYNATEWQTWMRKMSRKAHLKPDQEQVLSRYLDAIRTNGVQNDGGTVSPP